MAPSAAADASYLWFVLSLRLECRPGLSWEERPSGLDQDESWNKQWCQTSGSDYDWETCSTEVKGIDSFVIWITAPTEKCCSLTVWMEESSGNELKSHTMHQATAFKPVWWGRGFNFGTNHVKWAGPIKDMGLLEPIRLFLLFEQQNAGGGWRTWPGEMFSFIFMALRWFYATWELQEGFWGATLLLCPGYTSPLSRGLQRVIRLYFLLQLQLPAVKELMVGHSSGAFQHQAALYVLLRPELIAPRLQRNTAAARRENQENRQIRAVHQHLPPVYVKTRLHVCVVIHTEVESRAATVSWMWFRGWWGVKE